MGLSLATFAADAISLALALVLPALVACFVVGLALAFFEVMTQGQDASLGFVPRLLAVGVTVFLSAGFISAELVQFTERVFRNIALLAH
jgi:flagellar biosynthesis protein FliQ